MVRTRVKTSEHPLIVERVIDPNSEDLHDALDLYSQRIPEQEQVDSPDIVRWIREDLEHIERGALRPRDYFLIAKTEEQLLGFVLLHHYPDVQFAFIAYLVAAKDSSVTHNSRDGISKKLLAEVRNLLKPGKDLEACQGLLLEVDRPASADTEPERIRRLARIKLFCMLAEAQGFSLRAFDMDYLQPPLSLSDPDSSVPMLLMYVSSKTTQPASFMSSTSVRQILKFIYTDLYPEGYSDNELENRAYEACLRKFCIARSKIVPKRVRMLDFKQLKGTLKRTTVVAKAECPAASNYEYDVFISYRHKGDDEVFALKLVEELESAGFKAAIDQRDFDAAASFLEEMERCIRNSRFTLCVLSPRYFKSGNTMEEAVICKVMALAERQRRLIPLVTSLVEMPFWLYNIVGVDFTGVKQLVDPMEKLKTALRKGWAPVKKEE